MSESGAAGALRTARPTPYDAVGFGLGLTITVSVAVAVAVISGVGSVD